MCYYVEYIEKLENYFLDQFGQVLDKTIIEGAQLLEIPFYHFVGGFEHPAFPIVTNAGVETMEWGLIPFWTKDMAQAKDIRIKTLNAIGETAFDKPSFRESIKKRRGLLIITAFFEWRDVAGKKYPYRITLKDQGKFALGTIYDKWVDKSTGEVKTTFSIVTTPANELMEKIHNLKKRMPLIIPPGEFKHWLDPNAGKEQVLALIKPYPADQMTAYTISQFANSSRNYRNVPEISEAFIYPAIEAVL